MTTNIPTENEQVLHRSPHRPLTPDETLDKDGPDTLEQSIARVCEKLETQVLPREWEDIEIEDTS